MKKRNHQWCWCARVGLMIILMITACGEDDSPVIPPPEKTAEELTAEGWIAFEGGDLAEASTSFAEAIQRDSSYVEAYLGEGWSQFGLATDTVEFLRSLERLDVAILCDSCNADAYAGRAVVLLALSPDSLPAAVAAARAALNLSPEFAFSHRPSFDFKDLLLVQAFALAGQRHFPAALAAADQVEESGILADDPESWWVDGVPRRSYVDAVLAHLNRLSRIVAG